MTASSTGITSSVPGLPKIEEDLDPQVSAALNRFIGMTSSRAISKGNASADLRPSAECRKARFRYDESVHPMAERAAKACESLAKRFRLNKRDPFTLLVLAGGTGCGKSHLARGVYRWTSAIAIDAWAAGYWPRQVPSTAFLDWPGFVESDQDGVARDLAEADLAVLDDVGAEVDRFKNGAPTETLRRFLELRAGRFTVVTTNVPVSQWDKRWDARVADRLYRRSFIVDMIDMPSWSKR